MLGGGANSRHLANKNEPSECGGDAAFYRVTLTTCFLWRRIIIIIIIRTTCYGATQPVLSSALQTVQYNWTMGPTDIGGPGSQQRMGHIL